MTVTIEITPYTSMHNVELGASKEIVRNVIKEEPDARHDIRGAYTDYFAKSGLFVYYTGENGVCTSAELIANFAKPFSALVNNVRVNSLSFKELLHNLYKIDSSLYTDGIVFLFLTIGVALYTEHSNEEYEYDTDDASDSITVFSRGLFDSLIPTFRRVTL